MLVSAVAEVDDRLIAESDRSQNRTAAEHGIGPSLYCSIKKSLVVQCLVARPPGPPYKTHLIVAVGSLARLFSDSAAYNYVVKAPCISRDSDLAQCTYQSNQFNQNLS